MLHIPIFMKSLYQKKSERFIVGYNSLILTLLGYFLMKSVPENWLFFKMAQIYVIGLIPG